MSVVVEELWFLTPGESVNKEHAKDWENVVENQLKKAEEEKLIYENGS